jgi:hypothetical protein
LVGLIIFVALTVDMSGSFWWRRILQNTADGGALAGAQELARQINAESFNDTLIRRRICEYAEENGVEDTDGVPGNTVNDNIVAYYTDEKGNRVSNTPIGQGTVPNKAWGVEVFAYGTAQSYFGGMLGFDSYAIEADAAAIMPKACGADCVVPIATHMDTITTTPGVCLNIFNGDGPGNFGWLNWSEQGFYCDQDDCSVPCLADNLTPNICHSGIIEVGDWVAGSPGDMNSGLVWAKLKYYINTPEEFTVIVWDSTKEAGGCNQLYKVAGLARMQLLGYQLAQGVGNAYGHDGVGCIDMGLQPGVDPNNGVRLTAEFRGWVGGQGGRCKAVGTVRSIVISR